MRFRQQAALQGFAVVDLETTGLYPRTDRAAGVAVVHARCEGQVTGEFTTLVNPGRDVGPPMADEPFRQAPRSVRGRSWPDAT